MCYMALKEVMGDEMDGVVYNTQSILEMAAGKFCATIFLIFGFHLTGVHGDMSLLLILLRLMLVDLVLGVVCAIKNKKWNAKIFLVRGVVKFPLYALYIFLIGALDHLISRFSGIDSGWGIKLFIAYLIVCECYSVLRTVSNLGLPIPPLLQYYIERIKNLVERKGRDAVDTHLPPCGGNKPKGQQKPVSKPSIDDDTEV